MGKGVQDQFSTRVRAFLFASNSADQHAHYPVGLVIKQPKRPALSRYAFPLCDELYFQVSFLNLQRSAYTQMQSTFTYNAWNQNRPDSWQSISVSVRLRHAQPHVAQNPSSCARPPVRALRLSYPILNNILCYPSMVRRQRIVWPPTSPTTEKILPPSRILHRKRVWLLQVTIEIFLLRKELAAKQQHSCFVIGGFRVRISSWKQITVKLFMAILRLSRSTVGQFYFQNSFRLIRNEPRLSPTT
jgi:hypothetical protein